MAPITLVCATRLSEGDFYTKSPLGRSLHIAYCKYPFKIDLYPETRGGVGLGILYNNSISNSTDSDDIFVFIHDDVYIADFFWIDRILEGFQRFALLGLVGNKARAPRQPSWAFIDDKGTWDLQSNFSGIIGHGKGFPCDLTVLGPVPQQCKLLDGVFLATRKRTLRDNRIKFDERFPFHFYDMDLCRQFEQKNLPIGTIPVSVVHESEGSAGSPEWRMAYARYLAKWTV